MNKSKSLTGGQAAIKSLKKEKVKHVFGLIGSATMEMFDALYYEKNIKFIGVRDERTGTHMADGYARASNRPGVILAGQNGPGATNLVTGLAQAKAAFSPVVSIAGSYSTKDKMEDAFQGLDQQSLFKPVTKGKLDLLSYDFLHKRNMLFGTPEYVIDKIHELKAELNLQNLQVWSNFPGVKHEDCMKSIKMFTEKVMPHFKDDLNTEVKKVS